MIQDRIKNSIFDKQFLVLICLFLISIVPGLNLIGLFIQVLLFVSLSFKKDKSNLAVLLFSYSLYGSSVSIYSFKIIYALILLYAIISFQKIFISFKFSFYKATFAILIFLYFTIFSLIKNFYVHPKSFFSDLIIVTGFFAGLILFYNVTKEQLIKIAKKLLAFYIVTSLFCIFFDYGFSTSVDWWGRHTRLLVVGESFSIFLFILLYFLFFKKNKSIIPFCTLIFYLVIAIKLQDVGSMVTIFFILCLIFLTLLYFVFAKHKFKIIVFVLLSIFSIGFISNSAKFFFNTEKFEAIAFKMNNITKLFKNFSFSDRKKINLIPLSPYVRVLEMINITASGNPYTIIFGNGAGGSYTDDYYPFENKGIGKILGPDDFPEEQRKSHIFTSAHNTGYTYLKYGLGYFLFLLIFIFYRCVKNKKKDSFICYLGFVLYLTLTCYIGFTLQTSIAASILFLILYKNTNIKNLK
ncbi:MAG: hypothetical protein SPJ55_03545 [Treponema sp.]|nr:hypothetical protein [Treponema sp.]